MNITIKLEENVDVSFFTKMLSQIKGVEAVEVENENFLLKKSFQKSREQIRNGQSAKFSKSLMDSVFRKK